MEKKIVKETAKLIAMVMSYNNRFGTYPHVFASYRGHVKWVDIDIHAKGWVSGTDEEPMRWTIYEGADLSKEYAEIKAYLDAIK